jgi:two-component system, chemotaxis family, chemotaxis protein CheY
MLGRSDCAGSIMQSGAGMLGPLDACRFLLILQMFLINTTLAGDFAPVIRWANMLELIDHNGDFYSLNEYGRERFMTILVADDDPICRKIVVLRLRGLGDFKVAEAADGNEALAMLKRNHYDGLIVDWQMPGRSGLEIVREIRKAGVAMPMLMVTGESDKQKVVEAIRAGVTDYLIKPFVKETLQAKLIKFVEWFQPAAAAGV